MLFLRVEAVSLRENLKVSTDERNQRDGATLMPYIDKVVREGWDEHLEPLINDLYNEDRADLAGICNYIITRILSHGFGGKRYDMINSAIGVLECAKMEFYRRLAVPYEDHKKETNGDVY